MTDPNYTHITVLIDSSSSMAPQATDTRGGFNSFLTEQQGVKGKATMTVCKFSTGYEILHNLCPIKEVSPLTEVTYRPVGYTALLDALGRCITDLGAALAAMPEKKRPSKVLFLVITDGQENCSKEFTKAAVAKMVKEQEEVYKWNFLYLGANVDAFAESADLGIRAANAINYTADSHGIDAAYSVMSRSVGATRLHGDANASYSLFSSKHVDDLKDVDFSKKFSKLKPATPPDTDSK